MWFESILRRETGCVTYMVGSTASGECAVFDPLWDVDPYLHMAASKSSRIRYVIDSHSHADHVSGARRLAAACSGELVLPELAEITYEATRVAPGDRLTLGEVTLGDFSCSRASTRANQLAGLRSRPWRRPVVPADGRFRAGRRPIAAGPRTGWPRTGHERSSMRRYLGSVTSPISSRFIRGM